MAATPKVVSARVPLVPFADGVDSLRDPCAVKTEGLACVVEQFVTHYRRSHGDYSPVDSPDAFSGAVVALAEQTRRSDPYDVGVSETTIRAILQRRYRTTDLQTADALVVAANQPGALASFDVVPNPRAAKSVRGSCCGDVSAMHLNGCAAPPS